MVRETWKVTPAINEFVSIILFTEFLNQSLLKSYKFIEDNKKLKSWLWKMRRMVRLPRSWILNQQKSARLALFLINIYLNPGESQALPLLEIQASSTNPSMVHFCTFKNAELAGLLGRDMLPILIS